MHAIAAFIRRACTRRAYFPDAAISTRELRSMTDATHDDGTLIHSRYIADQATDSCRAIIISRFR